MRSSNKTFSLLLVSLIVCLFEQASVSAETNIYVFGPEQSSVVQTGGIAGVHETYSIEGQFQLTVDFDAGVASFDSIDANLIGESPFLPNQTLGELFNMTELLGTVVGDTVVEFEGKTTDGTDTDILLWLFLTDGLLYLTGETIPPPGSADFFYFNLDAVAQRKYGGGSGTAGDPYLIYTAEQMNAIGAEPNDWDMHFKLMANIDLSEYTGDEFNIIGECYYESGWIERPFTGIFDGNGHIISNFSYTSTDTDYVGLFGYVGTWEKYGLIKDLGLIDPNVDAGIRGYVGSLVGVLKKGTVTSCYIEGGNVVGGNSVGGLVGAYGEGVRGYPTPDWTISNCYSTSSVKGASHVGGLVGSNYEGRITNCYAMGSVLGNVHVGGLVGANILGAYMTGRPQISNCYSTGSVTGAVDIGGLVGRGAPSRVDNSFWDIETSGKLRSNGGMGKTTVEMQTINTFLDAGWDFVDESVNGTEDIWSICEGTNYPRLVWQIPAGDFVCPDGITIDDFLFFIEHWQDDNCNPSNDYCQGTDLDKSGTVDADDLGIFFENWLESSEFMP